MTVTTAIHDDCGYLNEKEKALMEPDSQSSSSITDSDSSSRSGEENSDRGNWAGRMDFLLSCIGYAVGLGNIWRFPYLCYRNGGAVFLIPYFTFLILCGMPLVFMEMSFGQFASLSPITVWRVSPLFKGIGYGMVFISGLVCVYYNIIIAWTLYYLYLSCRAYLPWNSCNNWWNTKACALRVDGALNGTSLNSTLENVTATLGSYVTAKNVSSVANETIQKKTPSEEFWQRYVLQLSEGIENMGEVRTELVICLAAAWILVFLCLVKGVKSSGRVVYFTATFPYVVLLILLIRGVTLPGASEGIKFYLIPKWHKLLSLQVWGEAAMQIFYSQGAAWGALITMASYNKFNNNCYRDARLVPVLNAGTSVFAGFVIFSIIGFMAHETGAAIKDVVTQGPGLVFVVYPEAVTKLPISPLWAVLFFCMLFTIGLDSQFGMFETVTSAFIDEFPNFLKNKKAILNVGLCFIMFLLGIPCVTKGGVYFLQIMDWYSSTFSLMIISFCECVAIAWVYGADRLYKDIELMIGYKPFIWWKICWKFITPVMILFVFLFSVIMHAPVTYGTYQYPGWAVGIGWVMALFSMVPLPICALMAIFKQKGTFLQRLKASVLPSAEWGPALTQHREMYIHTLDEKSRANTMISILGEPCVYPDEKKQLQYDLEHHSTV